jgi:hypothetical protein
VRASLLRKTLASDSSWWLPRNSAWVSHTVYIYMGACRVLTPFHHIEFHCGFGNGARKTENHMNPNPDRIERKMPSSEM